MKHTELIYTTKVHFRKLLNLNRPLNIKRRKFLIYSELIVQKKINDPRDRLKLIGDCVFFFR